MQRENVVIIGGGPAGAATALALAQRGIQCRVLESSAAAVAKVGETLPPTVQPILRRLGVESCVHDAAHLCCYGNAFAWGSSTVQERTFLQSPHGHGWHIDRQHFERQLCERAIEVGVVWDFGCKVQTVDSSRAGGWRIEAGHANVRQAIETEFVVDASGRSAKLSRTLDAPRNRYDRLIAIACALPQEREIEQFTFVEAVANGWWYAAPLAGNQIMLVFLTDSDLIAGSPPKTTFFTGLDQTSLMRSIISPTPETAMNVKVVVRPVETSALRTACGQNWLAVGDAAFAFDPISSYGITSALAGGFRAGNAIADHLAANVDALPVYRWSQEEEFLLYLQMLANQYRLETRWPDHPFWALAMEINSLSHRWCD